MACLLTSGRALPCKSSVGGLKAVYFKYDIKGSSSLETAITSSRENGTTFYTQTLNLTLTTLDKETQEEIKLLASSRPHVAIEDYNGNFFLVGLQHGAEVTGGTIVSGAAMGDLSGFTLTMEAMETSPANFTASTVVTDNESATQIDPNA